ncbi:ATP-binding protein [Cellulosilyticum sp. I15G10I2]|uniref:ATP-binding protein n=1 Tax=Cellulosilyticum sp. I15G10I2 TaxID=1892843 RepID=UPI00085C6B05|nr:ATP-binding protein [Cellulosilyticum sp. I15G10I2]
MELQKKLIEILKTTPSENSYLDYKQIPYKAEKQVDALKDIVAMLNSSEVIEQDKYIIFGIEDQTLRQIGLVFEMMDDAILQESMDKVEPRPKISSGTIQYQEMQFGYIYISGKNTDRPYVIKENYKKGSKNIQAGQSFIRKASKNYHMSRNDLDDIYKYGKIEVMIYNKCISVKPVSNMKKSKKEPNYTYGIVDVTLRNHTNLPISIAGGVVEIYDQGGQLRTRGGICGIGHTLNIVDYPYKLIANDEETMPVYFEFTSDDCIRLEVNKDGFSNLLITARVDLWTIDDKLYTTREELCTFRAWGEVLHKVRIKY